MSRQDIKVVWPDNYELTFPDETPKTLFYQLEEMEQFDPEDVPPSHFVLETGLKLRFDKNVMRQCFYMGKLTFSELTEELEIKQNLPKIKSAMRPPGPVIQ